MQTILIKLVSVMFSRIYPKFCKYNVKHFVQDFITNNNINDNHYLCLNVCSVPSLLSLLSMLSLLCQSVVSEHPIQHIRGVTLEECGIGRESQLFDDTCFQWHRMVYAKNDIQNGRNATIGEMPYIAMVYIQFQRKGETKWREY